MQRLTNTSSEELTMPIDIDPLLMQQLLETFRVELEERIQIISDALLNLEKGVAAEQQQIILDDMFRAAHNIKGASRGIGLENTARLSHHLESLFTALKHNEIHLQNSIVSLCLNGLDTLRELLDIDGQGNPPGEKYDELLLQLEMAAQGKLASNAQDDSQSEQDNNEVNVAQINTSLVNPILSNPQQSNPAGSIRIPVQRLDRIAALTNELQISQLRVEQHQSDAKKISSLSQQLRRYWTKVIHSNIKSNRWEFSEGANLIMELDALCQNIDTSIRTTHALLKPLSTKLRDDVRQLRLIPAETILNPLKRVVRDIAQTENKEVELIIEGGQIEVDRVVLEKIRDPLIHLLRNAVDHGIESPDKRIQIEKSKTGQIKILLTQDGNNINLSISDDGAGINIQTIKDKAFELEFATREELDNMSNTEISDYIFRPGFSSKHKISEISGRGVGLDVVRSNLQMIKGRVSVSSSEKLGSLFLLTIPFTMASEYGLYVYCSDQTFVIPAQSIKRIIEITAADIIYLESKQAVLVDGTPVILQNLSKLLHLNVNTSPVDGIYHVVVVHSGWKQTALIVNNIIGEQEMVIKPLKKPLDNLTNFSGGTLSNDGNIILVIDINGLLGQQTYSTPIPSLSDIDNNNSNNNADKILIVDDSITTRTLEASILEREGYQVHAVVNAEEAIEKLQAEHFDLLITDVEMPGMNGFELTHQVRTNLGLNKLPVIIVTSLASEANRRRGLEVKADAYIVKSDFESKELLKTIAQLI